MSEFYPGKEIFYLREEAEAETSPDGRARFANNPQASRNTVLVAAALTAGIKFASSKPFLDCVEDPGEGRPPKRLVSWALDPAATAEFAPDFPREQIGVEEFRRRFEDEAWCLANPSHPISFLRFFADNYARLRARCKEIRPLALVRKGAWFALVDPEKEGA